MSLTNGRPSARNFSYADTLKSFMRATSVRIRLLRTKTLLGHLMAKARQDPTVTRRVSLLLRPNWVTGLKNLGAHIFVFKFFFSGKNI